jgi:CO/xanthine dehydrogenase Mo-binding subunit
VPFLPAVATAIHDAVGVWLTAQPFTPERVLASLSAAGAVSKEMVTKGALA